jgi:hypothetical protein
MWGIMTQIAQKRLYFSIGGSSSTQNDADDIYIDIAACLSAVNRKQYHQFTAKGDPLCYTVTVTSLVSGKPLEMCTAQNTWTTRNAAKKTAEGWMEQLKNANIRKSELPTYAKRFRVAFEKDAHVTDANLQTLQKQLVPDGCDGDRLFTGYTVPDGETADFFTANEICLLSVGETVDYRAILCTATSGSSFGIIDEYLKSRRNMRERADPDTEFPSTTGFMNTLFATSEDTADDVTAAVDDYNLDRPYSETDAPLPVLASYTAAGTTNYRETFSAPLGLIKIAGVFGVAEADRFIIDVEAVYEM